MKEKIENLLAGGAKEGIRLWNTESVRMNPAKNRR